MRNNILLLVMLALASSAQGQVPAYELYLIANTNLHIPYATPGKKLFPVLWYNSETEPNLLIGGFGLGIAAIRPSDSTLIIKYQANLTRSVYWDEPNFLVSHSNMPIAEYIASSADYSLGFAATGHFMVNEYASIGTGLGAHILITSLTRQSNISASSALVTEPIIVNRYYKTFMPVIPVEMMIKTNRHIFNIRYELALLNRYKNELRKVKSHRYGLLMFEMGFRLGAKNY